MDASTFTYGTAAALLMVGLAVVVAALVQGNKDRQLVTVDGDTLYPGELNEDRTGTRAANATAWSAMAVANILIAGAFVLRVLVAASVYVMENTPGVNTWLAGVASWMSSVASWMDSLWVMVTFPILGWTYPIHWGVIIGAIVIMIMPLTNRSKLRGYITAFLAASALVLGNIAMIEIAEYLGTPLQYLGG